MRLLHTTKSSSLLRRLRVSAMAAKQDHGHALEVLYGFRG